MSAIFKMHYFSSNILEDHFNMFYKNKTKRKLRSFKTLFFVSLIKDNYSYICLSKEIHRIMFRR